MRYTTCLAEHCPLASNSMARDVPWRDEASAPLQYVSTTMAAYRKDADWHRLCAHDQRSALNYIAPEKISGARALVRKNQAIRLNRRVDLDIT
jgi:hypothetical protein